MIKKNRNISNTLYSVSYFHKYFDIDAGKVLPYLKAESSMFVIYLPCKRAISLMPFKYIHIRYKIYINQDR